ncbi:hypothetical protein B0J11DRAFT_534424 [Dendryphion nanum]|uniref:Heterokaryon incompatibility domain-containing protein n=1 Tax=Dendryphion nanum TaxID=256645 RepID=A0A9P9IF99_9PLEO|nr:hypothetical protein B0J11DRAFT_534424 [Dendryphion nanum]
MVSGLARNKKGFKKLQGCCKKAAADGFLYCWVDTCCIDKTSSVELSEAINSMYRYYKQSVICYVYLADYEISSTRASVDHQKFAKCRWWKRGWTLQELIAPVNVEFYSASWVELGTKRSMEKNISHITGVNTTVLTGSEPFYFTVAVRMTWAAGRETSRVEDQAYCLMGIFGVNMPLLYGEGHRAFVRLQEEIMRINEDYTIFAWTAGPSYQGLLATSPDLFQRSLDSTTIHNGISGKKYQLRTERLAQSCYALFHPPEQHEPPSFTSRGIRVTLPFCSNTIGSYACITLLKNLDTEPRLFCLRLWCIDMDLGQFVRTSDNLSIFPKLEAPRFEYRTIYVRQPPSNEIPRSLSSMTKRILMLPVLLFMKMDLLPSQNLIPSSAWIDLENLMGISTKRLNTATKEKALSFMHDNGYSSCWVAESPIHPPAVEYSSKIHFKDSLDLGGNFCVILFLTAREARCQVLDLHQNVYRSHWSTENDLEPVSDRASLYTRQVGWTLDRHLPDIETIVNVRPLASTANGMSQFMLSISQRYVEQSPNMEELFASIEAKQSSTSDFSEDETNTTTEWNDSSLKQVRVNQSV